jgi:glutathione S-transferase
MGEEVVFYSSPMSRGRMVRWMLEEAGAPYRYEMVNLESGEQKKPAYLAVNRMGKVPAIVHRGTVITECGAICSYLAEPSPPRGWRHRSTVRCAVPITAGCSSARAAWSRQ